MIIIKIMHVWVGAEVARRVKQLNGIIKSYAKSFSQIFMPICLRHNKPVKPIKYDLKYNLIVEKWDSILKWLILNAVRQRNT